VVPKLQKMGAVNILASMLVDRILSREERLDGRRELDVQLREKNEMSRFQLLRRENRC